MLNIAGGAAATGYNLTRSLRFRASATAYLNRTPASAGDRKKFTWSGWVKRGEQGVYQGILSGGSTSPSYDVFEFDITTNRLAFFQSGGNTTALYTNAVFRDSAAWYHIVFVYDSAQATAANRALIYVNGVLQTLTGTFPTLNLDSFINTTFPHAIGAVAASGTFIYPFDGYLAETYFIDAQALTPSSFGSTNALTGVWQPIPYVGTYGTNGFYLPFTDNSALTTSSNVGLGQDFSGNANYWTTNNISITAGVTYDSMTDVPTLTSATAANFPTLNPLNSVGSSDISAGNLTRTGGNNYTLATMGMPLGKWYAEMTVTTVGTESSCGVATAADISGSGVGNNAFSWGYFNNGNKYNNGVSTAYGASYTSGDVIGIAFDNTIGTLTFYKNNVSQGAAFTSLSANTYFFAMEGRTGGTPNNVSINFGQRPFAYTPPTGFVALNTFNLPTATILKGNTQMDATLYTGTGASLAVTNAASFQPDLVWMKGRSGATDHAWYDSVRGVQNQLESNTTTAETAEATGLTAFGSGGFTVGALAQVNTSAATYVGWQWKGGGAAVSNTAGTITSQVSANASAGFSIATFFGTSANATVGHGLGVAPKFIVVKNRSSGAWYSYHVSSGAGNYLVLNANSANAADTTAWNNTAPSSSVFYLGSNVVINPAATCIAYCWAEIDGFSKFGSYTGNGSTDGPFVYTGFRPRWLMIKRTDSTSNWYIFDTARNTFNVMTDELLANSSNAEANNNRWIDCLSNGFKIRNDAASQINASGGTMVYACFSENPFKNSLAR
jgi:hypothetical protein